MIERLDHFMARANAAYYATHDPFADFTTAPEISQVFGEIMGLWAATVWDSMGRPAEISLIEAGPGRGTLMADALRAMSQVIPAFRAAATVHLIETSPRLRAAQRETIGPAVWHDELETVPAGPMILLANEFLDALPIRQFVRRGAAWAERFVNGQQMIERFETRLPWGDVPPCDAHEGDVVEWCDMAEAFTAAIARRLTRDRGAALFLDYGPEISGAGDSLQAIAGGEPVEPLAPAGTADLTAHVDFARLAAVARAAGAMSYGAVPQGMFLARLGLFQRTNQLARHQSPARAAALMDGARRLGEPDRMGRLFKALALTSPELPMPAGFI